MKQLLTLRKYFWQNKTRLFLGILFTTLSNYFGVLSPQVTKYVINKIADYLNAAQGIIIPLPKPDNYEGLLSLLIHYFNSIVSYKHIVIYCGITLIILALLRGLFTYLMRQTIIVMSRHIEYTQKNDVYQHYQLLDATFYKQHSTGDLMNRISEDVSKVRMFTGPAIMYGINLTTLIGLSVYYMLSTSPILTLYTIAPLPLLAFIIYKVNLIINKKSEAQQAQLSAITTTAQEVYSGIRVVKSYNYETAMQQKFAQQTQDYKQKAISLSKTEAWYFPSIALLIGLSTLFTIMIGGIYKVYGTHNISLGVIAEFVVYINMLTFPVSSIGWVASIIQRSVTSQGRINQFLVQQPLVPNTGKSILTNTPSTLQLHQVNFTYTNTGIQALQLVNLTILPSQTIAIIGKTGSGKTTLLQLLMRLYPCTSGEIVLAENPYQQYTLASLRSYISYVPQEVFLFSDSIINNIKFGINNATQAQVEAAAKAACVYDEIMDFEHGFNTMVGERGITLSGGQKQRITIARALLKQSSIYLFDDCLSAVDASTEATILQNIKTFIAGKTIIFVTHRLFNAAQFTNMVILHNGTITEQGNHLQLMQLKGSYYAMYNEQQQNY